MSAHVDVRGLSPSVPYTYYGAGYFVYQNPGDDVSAGATFNAPAISCASASDYEWLLPGIWIYDTSGNLIEQVDVNLNCNAGSQLRVDVICVNGGGCDNSLTINPNDTIEVSWINGQNGSVGTVRDRTQHTSASVTGPTQTTDYTIFIGDEGPSLFPYGTAVPTFNKVVFSTVTVNGEYLSDRSYARYNLRYGSDVQIAAGAISLAGTGFPTTFKHNN